MSERKSIQDDLFDLVYKKGKWTISQHDPIFDSLADYIRDNYIHKDDDLIALFKTWCKKQGYVKSEAKGLVLPEKDDLEKIADNYGGDHTNAYSYAKGKNNTIDEIAQLIKGLGGLDVEKIKEKDNQISLLSCLMETMNVPKHKKSFCETNKCARCNWECYAKEYLELNKGLYWLEDYIKTKTR